MSGVPNRSSMPEPGEHVRVTYYENDRQEELVFEKISGLGYRVVSHPRDRRTTWPLDPRDKMELILE